VLRWLQVNVALMVFVVSICTGITTMVISGATHVSDVAHELSSLTAAQADDKVALTQEHADMVDVDKRINALNAGLTQAANAASVALAQSARECDQHTADLAGRVAVLEAQIKFLADRLPPPQIGRR
jgi:hypothetical protein